MQYRQYTPIDSLKHLVRYYWSLDGRQDSISRLSIESFADRYPRLIFQDIDCFEPIINSTGEEMPLCYLKGVRTRPTEAFMHGAFSHFGVAFYPHALSNFFGIDSDELTDTTPNINLVCRCDLGERLRFKTHAERVAILDGFLLGKMTKLCLDFTVQSIIHKKGKVSDMEMLASALRISERQLQRRFKKQVGISLKRYQRVSRFELALKRLATVHYSELTSIAFELDYTDQSHFIKEFQEFAEMSPYNFVRNKSVGAESSSFLYIPIR
ncbi:helix-turn-helix transcriptional regulator [Rhodocytophaga rosea]|uniref:Helix-turn-helix transcriptional regulator n=1 Tax=Rhodocytophaga rosea TaxID=2704465 RepID=A0A6C0GBE0_9BACT|nr:helix-turn-helix transcriptional regulator [Rhodocytophaga rosea]QHT65251.1 helix-turn-helix transcriptional regulator [Rhodocytophaga rosea]